ncbi:aldehyde dehydrogenase [Rhodoferax lacus]|uniref:Aldehyde dehydrogenase n=1 Tax=Rhodoferax lacus TaxID=2184758 RepID=A0A3E1R9J7_9BURK|nr:aldehyde dehydrogenase [Rhodoferax lacus]RFO95702.1 aldehyde dehydrogenase [Rhodoferax lacus]
MSDVHTFEDYAAIAKHLNFQSRAFINGAFCDALSGETFASLNPATGAVLAQVAACGKADVDVAVQAAKAAFDDGRWSRLHPSDRKAVLMRFAQLMEDNATELSVLESVDSGKPVGECVGVDIPETIKTIRWHAELIDKIYDTTAPAGPNVLALVSREAIGVVGLVLPWNFPLLMLAWKIGPALAAGCSVIVKPAELTTLSTLRVAELAQEAGIPAGVFNVVTGSGKDAGEPIGLHPEVDMVSFTGSTVTGKRFLRYAADSNLKRIVLECGGKNPAVVLGDAEDLDAVAAHVVNGAFWNMGENCSATSRLIVQASIKDKLLEAVGRALEAWKTGDPLDPANKIGALVSCGHFEKVNSYLEQAKADGCKFAFGGRTYGGAFVEPTVVEGVTPQSRLFREEIFGPILCVTTFDTVPEAVALANDTVYGLAASVYTANQRHAMKLAREIRAGTVTVNCFGEGDVSTPFGGFKESGFGGRDKSIHAHDQYTELKTVWIDITEPAAE